MVEVHGLLFMMIGIMEMAFMGVGTLALLNLTSEERLSVTRGGILHQVMDALDFRLDIKMVKRL